MFFLLSLLSIVNSTYSQTFSVSEIDATNYPSVVANFTAANALAQPYFNLTSNDFIVKENGFVYTVPIVGIILFQ